MQIFECTCLNCGAKLQLDLDNVQMFCSNCGSKILIESDTLSRILAEREKTRRLEIRNEHEEKMYYAKAKEREQVAKRNAKEKRFHALVNADTLGTLLRFLLLFAILFGVIYLFYSCYSESERARYALPMNSSMARGKTVDTVYNTFYEAGCRNIQVKCSTELSGVSGNVSEGEVIRVLANGDPSFTTEEVYKRLGDVSIVIEFYSPDGMVPFPFSSKDIKGQDAWQVMRKLKKSGFSNIQEVTKKKFLNTEGEIKKMTVDGKTKFDAGDRIDVSVPIVIEYVEYESY